MVERNPRGSRLHGEELIPVGDSSFQEDQAPIEGPSERELEFDRASDKYLRSHLGDCRVMPYGPRGYVED